jgi:23S rRNA U2552 (ribose-2'-O)-methylase RlmE/FtsJ
MNRSGIIDIIVSDASQNRCGAGCPQAYLEFPGLRYCRLTRRTQNIDSPRSLECCDAEAKMAALLAAQKGGKS